MILFNFCKNKKNFFKNKLKTYENFQLRKFKLSLITSYFVVEKQPENQCSKKVKFIFLTQGEEKYNKNLLVMKQFFLQLNEK